MASTTLINANSDSQAVSIATEIVGTNTIVVTGAEMKDRVEVHLDGTPVEPIDGPPWARTLVTGKVDLVTKTRNRSGNAITVRLETEA